MRALSHIHNHDRYLSRIKYFSVKFGYITFRIMSDCTIFFYDSKPTIVVDVDVDYDQREQVSMN